ncbi:MAG: nucleotidyltransferase domain-containing protein [Candidatus Thermoplasmatota archaeon]|nr:nucleotidyltransferase domain-containing protein [Candidatus Thermoplasmatota archaeon]
MINSQDKAIRRFTSDAKRILRDNVIDILIYGSVARGEAKKESDIDVIVIVKRNAFKMQMRLAALSFDILLETGEYISVQTLKSKELKRDTIFLHNVKRDAIHAL